MDRSSILSYSGAISSVASAALGPLTVPASFITTLTLPPPLPPLPVLPPVLPPVRPVDPITITVRPPPLPLLPAASISVPAAWVGVPAAAAGEPTRQRTPKGKFVPPTMPLPIAGQRGPPWLLVVTDASLYDLGVMREKKAVQWPVLHVLRVGRRGSTKVDGTAPTAQELIQGFASPTEIAAPGAGAGAGGAAGAGAGAGGASSKVATSFHTLESKKTSDEEFYEDEKYAVGDRFFTPPSTKSGGGRWFSFARNDLVSEPKTTGGNLLPRNEHRVPIGREVPIFARTNVHPNGAPIGPFGSAVRPLPKRGIAANISGKATFDCYYTHFAHVPHDVSVPTNSQPATAATAATAGSVGEASAVGAPVRVSLAPDAVFLRAHPKTLAENFQFSVAKKIRTKNKGADLSYFYRKKGDRCDTVFLFENNEAKECLDRLVKVEGFYLDLYEESSSHASRHITKLLGSKRLVNVTGNCVDDRQPPYSFAWLPVPDHLTLARVMASADARTPPINEFTKYAHKKKSTRPPIPLVQPSATAGGAAGGTEMNEDISPTRMIKKEKKQTSSAAPPNAPIDNKWSGRPLSYGPAQDMDDDAPSDVYRKALGLERPLRGSLDRPNRKRKSDEDLSTRPHSSSALSGLPRPNGAEEMQLPPFPTLATAAPVVDSMGIGDFIAGAAAVAPLSSRPERPCEGFGPQMKRARIQNSHAGLQNEQNARIDVNGFQSHELIDLLESGEEWAKVRVGNATRAERSYVIPKLQQLVAVLAAEVEALEARPPTINSSDAFRVASSAHSSTDELDAAGRLLTPLQPPVIPTRPCARPLLCRTNDTLLCRTNDISAAIITDGAPQVASQPSVYPPPSGSEIKAVATETDRIVSAASSLNPTVEWPAADDLKLDLNSDMQESEQGEFPFWFPVPEGGGVAPHVIDVISDIDLTRPIPVPKWDNSDSKTTMIRDGALAASESHAVLQTKDGSAHVDAGAGAGGIAGAGGRASGDWRAEHVPNKLVKRLYERANLIIDSNASAGKLTHFDILPLARFAPVARYVVQEQHNINQTNHIHTNRAHATRPSAAAGAGAGAGAADISAGAASLEYVYDEEVLPAPPRSFQTEIHSGAATFNPDVPRPVQAEMPPPNPSAAHERGHSFDK